jgi:hypothetical protein
MLSTLERMAEFIGLLIRMQDYQDDAGQFFRATIAQ